MNQLRGSVSRHRDVLVFTVIGAVVVSVIFLPLGVLMQTYDAQGGCGELGCDWSATVGRLLTLAADLLISISGLIAAVATRRQSVFVACLLLAVWAFAAYELGLAIGPKA